LDGRDGHAQDGEDGAAEHKDVEDELDDVVADVRWRETRVHVRVHVHGQHLVQSHILIVSRSVVVQATEVLVEQLERCLGISVVDPVVASAAVGHPVDHDQRETEQTGGSPRIEESVGIERVALVNPGVGDCRRKDLRAVEEEKRN